MPISEDNGVAVETVNDDRQRFEDPMGIFADYGEYDDRYTEEDWCDEDDRQRDEDPMGIFAGYGECDDRYFAEPPMCKWEDGDDFRDEWLYGDDFPTPFKFEGLAVPPPKPKHGLTDIEELEHSRYTMYKKRCRGQKPKYKEQRRNQRFSTILHVHVELTRAEWFFYDQRNEQQYRQQQDRDIALFELEEAMAATEEYLQDCCHPDEQLELEISLHELEMRYRQLAKAA
ncbi:MAG: hypothetical protein NTX82_05360 [Candidatus Parcubacteria bacterium]|nr:hypothetical protein [Candidatus Parcubacteria bacterium]